MASWAACLGCGSVPQTFRTGTKTDLKQFGGLTAFSWEDDIYKAQEDEKNVERLKALGGTLGILQALRSDPKRGLTGHPSDVAARFAQFGENCFREAPFASWTGLFFGSFNEPILLVLLVAALASIIIETIREPAHGWIDGLAIFFAVLIVALVTASNDYNKQAQFRRLSTEATASATVRVLRSGSGDEGDAADASGANGGSGGYSVSEVSVRVRDLLVGDVVRLESGARVPADGLVLRAVSLKVNESDLTGETDEKDKAPDGSVLALSVAGKHQAATLARVRAMTDAAIVGAPRSSSNRSSISTGRSRSSRLALQPLPLLPPQPPASSDAEPARGDASSGGSGGGDAIFVGVSTESAPAAEAAAATVVAVAPTGTAAAAALPPPSPASVAVQPPPLPATILALPFSSVGGGAAASAERPPDPFLLSGTSICGGTCSMLITAVGERSLAGQIRRELASEDKPTPLQAKLEALAALIGYVGLFFAIATFVALMSLKAAGNAPADSTWGGWTVDSIIYGVTIIVVAIPEGLPLAVTISLAYSTSKMLADKSLIRELSACETMGSATDICTDKTGTLTENAMTVVEMWAAGTHYAIQHHLAAPGSSAAAAPVGMSATVIHAFSSSRLSRSARTLPGGATGASASMAAAEAAVAAAAAADAALSAALASGSDLDLIACFLSGDSSSSSGGGGIVPIAPSTLPSAVRTLVRDHLALNSTASLTLALLSPPPTAPSAQSVAASTAPPLRAGPSGGPGEGRRLSSSAGALTAVPASSSSSSFSSSASASAANLAAQRDEVHGSKTEGAGLKLLRSMGYNYLDVRAGGVGLDLSSIPQGGTQYHRSASSSSIVNGGGGGALLPILRSSSSATNGQRVGVGGSGSVLASSSVATIYTDLSHSLLTRDSARSLGGASTDRSAGSSIGGAVSDDEDVFPPDGRGSSAAPSNSFSVPRVAVQHAFSSDRKMMSSIVFLRTLPPPPPPPLPGAEPGAAPPDAALRSRLEGRSFGGRGLLGGSPSGPVRVYTTGGADLILPCCSRVAVGIVAGSSQAKKGSLFLASASGGGGASTSSPFGRSSSASAPSASAPRIAAASGSPTPLGPEHLSEDADVVSVRDLLIRPLSPELAGHLLANVIVKMASKSLRTIALAYRDYPLGIDSIPRDVLAAPECDLTLHTILGIKDPVRVGVVEAVAIAAAAGIRVRMITGDNAITARAIAIECGILEQQLLGAANGAGDAKPLQPLQMKHPLGQPGGGGGWGQIVAVPAAPPARLVRQPLVLEGPLFRTLTPRQLDMILPRISVLARSAPRDKMVLVRRLNGALPKSQAEWEAEHPGRVWELDKDILLPGYYEEWAAVRRFATTTGASAQSGGGSGGHVSSSTNAASTGPAAAGSALGGVAIPIPPSPPSSTPAASGGAAGTAVLSLPLFSRPLSAAKERSLDLALGSPPSASAPSSSPSSSPSSPPLPPPDGRHLHRSVVGVTGDGTNDAPALKASDVGLAMGISGTDTAKEAAKIIITDDNFASIVAAISWGRAVYDNVQCFLQFQLTVNIVALIVTFVSACLQFNPPLNPIMMLWVNLIMDTMGALALATQRPAPERLLARRPYTSVASLISPRMWRHVLVQAAFQIALLFTLLALATTPAFGINVDFLAASGKYLSAGGPTEVDVDYYRSTFIFNAFVFCQIFNEFNSRSLGDDASVAWRGLHTERLFLAVIAISALFQAIMVEFFGAFAQTWVLPAMHWLYSIVFASITVPLGFAMRLIPVGESPTQYAVHFEELFAAKMDAMLADPLCAEAVHHPVRHLLAGGSGGSGGGDGGSAGHSIAPSPSVTAAASDMVSPPASHEAAASSMLLPASAMHHLHDESTKMRGTSLNAISHLQLAGHAPSGSSSVEPARWPSPSNLTSSAIPLSSHLTPSTLLNAATSMATVELPDARAPPVGSLPPSGLSSRGSRVQRVSTCADTICPSIVTSSDCSGISERNESTTPVTLGPGNQETGGESGGGSLAPATTEGAPLAGGSGDFAEYDGSGFVISTSSREVTPAKGVQRRWSDASLSLPGTPVVALYGSASSPTNELSVVTSSCSPLRSTPLSTEADSPLKPTPIPSPTTIEGGELANTPLSRAGES